MGTRSLTTFYDATWSKEGTPPEHVVTIYRHWDGYPSAHGADLAAFLDGRILRNGVPHPKPKKFANGTGRLATQFIAELDAAGHNPNIVPEKSDCGQEYHYVIIGHANRGDISVEVFEGPMTAFGGGGENCTNSIFKGSAAEYQTWIATPKGDDGSLAM